VYFVVKHQEKKIMTLYLNVLLCAMIVVFGAAGEVEAAAHRIGGGFHYWRTLEDPDVENVDEDGIAALISYQYQLREFLTFDATLEFAGKGYAGATQGVMCPQAYVLLGRAIYAGAGAGVQYSDGEFGEQPFLVARAGLDLEILPAIFLDLNAKYRMEQWDFEAVEGDALDVNLVTVGTALRIEFGGSRQTQ
jgi:hypothetical protein